MSWDIMHQSFETPAPPPHSGLSRGLRGLSPQIHSILVPREAENLLEVTVFASPTGDQVMHMTRQYGHLHA